MRTPCLLVVLALVLTACTSTADPVDAKPTLAPLTALPAELRPTADRALAAINALRAGLGTRLAQELQERGPDGAITVCRDDAPRITAEVERDPGLRVGRASTRLRNPKNTAPSWLAKHLARTADARAGDLDVVAVDLGDRVGVAMPIPTAKPCLSCHGPRDQIGASVRAVLDSSYPKDRAVGFGIGSLRGYFWAEAAKESPAR